MAIWAAHGLNGSSRLPPSDPLHYIIYYYRALPGSALTLAARRLKSDFTVVIVAHDVFSPRGKKTTKKLHHCTVVMSFFHRDSNAQSSASWDAGVTSSTTGTKWSMTKHQTLFFSS